MAPATAAVDSAALKSLVAEAVRKEMHAALKKELLPALQTEVQKTCKESFASSFERNVLPAFQDGTTELFRQIQTSFGAGMDKLTAAVGQTEASTAGVHELRAEVSALSEKVGRLTSFMEHLVDATGRNSAVLAMIQKAGVSGGGSVSPMELLEEGKVAEALEAALELKDITAILQVLEEVPASVLTEKCSKILLLCLTQQLAVDLSEANPAEGLPVRLDWIKNLVMHTLFNSSQEGSEEGDAAQQYVAVVMQSVKEAIKATQERIQSSGDADKPEHKVAFTNLVMLGHIVK